MVGYFVRLVPRRLVMSKKNCWEFEECGREVNGKKAKEFGVCPAATAAKLNGTNEGSNGGRACWAIAGTLCGGKIQGTYAQKLGSCLNCQFFDYVRSEQGENFIKSKQILQMLSQ